MKKLAIILILLFLALVSIYLFLNPSVKEFEEDDLYDKIIERDVIKVGVNVDSKPFAFYNNGILVGYDIDLARYIAQYILKNPNKVMFIPVTPANRLLKASTGDVDIVISTVTITPSRQEIVGFSIPYDSAGQAILVRANSKIKSLADIAGQNVGVIFGTTAEKNIKILIPTSNVIGFKNYKDAYLALKNSQINAITSDDAILSRFVIDDASVKLLPKRYSCEPYGIAFKKGYSTAKLKTNIDFAIKDLQQKNVINKLHKRWQIQ